MSIGASVVRVSIEHPKAIVTVMAAVTVVLALVAGLPSVWPGTFGMLNPLKVDTDPENMLPADEPVRVFHHEMKQALGLHDMVVLGVVNDTDPDGVFNPASLQRVYELTEYAKTLRWPDPDNPEEQVGVIEVDLIAPSMVDNIEQGGLGEVKFEWLMPRPPEMPDEARAMRDKALRIPFLNGTLVSEDGKALCLYLPLTSKDLSYRVYAALREKTAAFTGDDTYYITGLPVAEDTFGVEMFKQMAISAPLAMVIIFLLMLFFFRKLVLVISPMIVALVSVICTMGLLVASGNTIHIMSSMIPIFIMPIAVLDAIHILSDFFDRYQETKDRRTTMIHVMDTLFVPMLYTSLTTAAGFASLALTPIPPVQIFGLFIAFGVMAAWILTVTFIPAYVMFIPAGSLENFGMKPGHERDEADTPMGRFLAGTGRFTYRRAKLVLAFTVLAAAVAAYGISRISINDNPINWFTESHPIRVADRVLNEHFGGTYMAYLALEPETRDETVGDYVAGMTRRMDERAQSLAEQTAAAQGVFAKLKAEALRLSATAGSKKQLLDTLTQFAADQADQTEDDAEWEAWDEAGSFVGKEGLRDQVFKQPEALEYVRQLQERLLATGIVGKSNSLADIVKTVHRELMLGKEEEFRIPDSPGAVAQCLITYQNSHRPQDLWHFVTPDYRTTSLWVQLKSGDNKDMTEVAAAIDQYVAAHPPPFGLEHKWFGLTYINVIWQNKMVSGMLQAFLGSFLVVLLMMIILFRSALWGILSMIPLMVTIGFIYGMIGLVGKDYDMPVAVLSSLSLGLAVDYAIHFLARSRLLRDRFGLWETAAPAVFGEPARAISRNVIVVGVGFLPLLAAPLMPYKTVGVFIAAILFFAGVASLLILPALIRRAEKLLFPETRLCCVTCNCGTCVVSGVTAVALVAVNVHQFLAVGWTSLTWFSVAAIPVMLGFCALVSRRDKCIWAGTDDGEGEEK